MFDKNLFDRNAFDRSVSSDGIDLTMLGSGQVEFRLTVRMPIGNGINGVGSLAPNLRMQQRIVKTFNGTGDIATVTMILRRSTAAAFAGQGVMTPNLVVRTTIKGSLSGQGGFSVNSNMFLYQNIRGDLSGAGVFTPRPVLETAMPGSMGGSGQMSSTVHMQLPLTIAPHGQGLLTLRRLGALNENVIELIGINFLPGETITIDTDLLQVLFGATEDVSSITNESIFFELNPGENEITIDIDADSVLDIVAIWQNRWL